MKILVIDSIPTSKDVYTVSFTERSPCKDYIEHSNGLLNVFKQIFPYAELIFCNIAHDQGDTYYSCLENHKNFNKALKWAVGKEFDAIYAQVQFYCPSDADKSMKKKHAGVRTTTSKCIKKLGIPLVCPAENSEEERVDHVIFSPSYEEAEYVSSIKNCWPSTTVVKSKKYKWTSELAIVRLEQMLNPSR